MENEKKKRGGKKEGAGRPFLPKGTAITKTISICGSEKEITVLRSKADENNKSVSRYIFEELVGNIE